MRRRPRLLACPIEVTEMIRDPGFLECYSCRDTPCSCGACYRDLDDSSFTDLYLSVMREFARRAYIDEKTRQVNDAEALIEKARREQTHQMVTFMHGPSRGADADMCRELVRCRYLRECPSCHLTTYSAETQSCGNPECDAYEGETLASKLDTLLREG